jgi:hypothetical protein
VTIRLPRRARPGVDGLASALTHAQSISGGDTERVTVRPRYPTPTQCSCQRWLEGVTEYRMPNAGRFLAKTVRPWHVAAHG